MTIDAPITVAAGGLESAEFHRQTESLAEAWSGHGAAVSVLDVPGTNHFTIVEELARGGVLLERVLAMLE